MNTTVCNETATASVGYGTCGNETAGTDGGDLTESLWDLPVSDALAGFIASLYLVLFLVAFTWNLAVIIFVLKNIKLLREPSTIFLFCLAIVDLMEAVSSIPFYVATLIGGGWIFGDTDDMRMDFCEAVGFFLATFLSVSVHILAIIAFDRFLYIACAWNYKKLLQPWKAWLLVFVCCIPAVIVASTPLYGFGEFFFFREFGVCLFHWRGQRAYVIVFCLENMIPITAIVIFTTLTYCYVRRFLRNREKRAINLSNLNLNSIQSVNVTEEERVIKEHQAKRKTLTRLFVALLLSQLICFTPALLTAFVGFVVGSYDDVPNVVFFVDLLFVISNAAVNPIILTCARRSLRRRMFSMPRKVWRVLRCKEPSDNHDIEVAPTQERPSFTRQTTIESVLNIRVPPIDDYPPMKHNVSDSGNSTASSDPSPCEHSAFHSPMQTDALGSFKIPAADSVGSAV